MHNYLLFEELIMHNYLLFEELIMHNSFFRYTMRAVTPAAAAATTTRHIHHRVTQSHNHPQ